MRASVIVAIALVATMATGAIAQEAPVAAPSDPIAVAEAISPASTVSQLIGAVQGGQWRLAFALGLSLVMFGLAKLRDKIGIFRGDRGGAILIMILAQGTALAVALGTSEPLSWRLFLGAATGAFMAVGAFTWIRRLIWPKDSAAPPSEPTLVR